MLVTDTGGDSYQQCFYLFIWFWERGWGVIITSLHQWYVHNRHREESRQRGLKRRESFYGKLYYKIIRGRILRNYRGYFLGQPTPTVNQWLFSVPIFRHLIANDWYKSPLTLVIWASFQFKDVTRSIRHNRQDKNTEKNGWRLLKRERFAAKTDKHDEIAPCSCFHSLYLDR